MSATTPPSTNGSPTTLPRVVIAAPGSGHGKTTVASGLMAALRREGLDVGGFKVGPDFIDPGYHALATGRPGRNLDPVLTHPSLVEPLLLHGAQAHGPTDVAVIEGAMGLFDGRLGTDGFASTAHVATLTRSPIVLVLDVRHVSRTAAAIVHGLATFDPAVRLAGVIVNQSASERHTREVRSALEATGVPVLGVLPRDAGIEAPSRHLGLVPVEERAEAASTLDRLAEQVAGHVDLAAVLRVAHSAPPLAGMPWSPARALASVGAPPPPDHGRRPVVAVAAGRSFTFRYPETEELMRAAGLEPVAFDPLTAHALPNGTCGLYLGGGFPEVHATELSANHPLREAIRLAVADGLPTVAECAGLLYLCTSVDGHPMVGALPLTAAMQSRLTLGYRDAVAPGDSLLAAAGQRVTGHEFHRTTITHTATTDTPATNSTLTRPPSVGGAAGTAGTAEPSQIEAAWWLDGRLDGITLDPAGSGGATVHASYLHTHWAGHPALAARFAEAVHARATTTTRPAGVAAS